MPWVQDLKFGTVFTDHMFHVEHVVGKGWGCPTVKPIGYQQVHPASQVRTRECAAHAAVRAVA